MNTKEEYINQLRKTISFWEYKLSNNNYLLEPSVETQLRLTIRFLKDLLAK